MNKIQPHINRCVIVCRWFQIVDSTLDGGTNSTQSGGKYIAGAAGRIDNFGTLKTTLTQ